MIFERKSYRTHAPRGTTRRSSSNSTAFEFLHKLCFFVFQFKAHEAGLLNRLWID